jgi:hypothetical protein
MEEERARTGDAPTPPAQASAVDDELAQALAMSMGGGDVQV